MLLAVVKADNVIKSVLPGSSRSTEPSGSELQEPERKEVAEKSADSKDSFKSLASLVEGSLGQCVIRKPNKEDKDSDADMISGRLRSRIQALPVSAASQVEKMLPSAGGYDVNFSKPMSSRWLLRLEAVIQEPQDGEALLSPLTQRSCVLYTAAASTPTRLLNTKTYAFARCVCFAAHGFHGHVVRHGQPGGHPRGRLRGELIFNL